MQCFDEEKHILQTGTGNDIYKWTRLSSQWCSRAVKAKSRAARVRVWRIVVAITSTPVAVDLRKQTFMDMYFLLSWKCVGTCWWNATCCWCRWIWSVGHSLAVGCKWFVCHIIMSCNVIADDALIVCGKSAQDQKNHWQLICLVFCVKPKLQSVFRTQVESFCWSICLRMMRTAFYGTSPEKRHQFLPVLIKKCFPVRLLISGGGMVCNPVTKETGDHGCRSKQILRVRRIVARNSPNLPEKLLFNFCLQIFSLKEHENLFWRNKSVPDQKHMHVVHYRMK